MSEGEPARGCNLFPATIETARLQLERVEPEEPKALDLYDHWREGAPYIEETTEFVTWDPYRHPKGVAETLNRAVGHVEDAEGVMYIVRAADDDSEFAGTAGLSVDWERQRGDLGIWLRKPFWGRGYSGERADALLELAFGRLDLAVVGVAHLLDNENSERAITRYVERHRGHCEGTFRNVVTENDGTIHDVCSYTITAEEWADGAGALTDVRFRA